MTSPVSPLSPPSVRSLVSRARRARGRLLVAGTDPTRPLPFALAISPLPWPWEVSVETSQPGHPDAGELLDRWRALEVSLFTAQAPPAQAALAPLAGCWLAGGLAHRRLETASAHVPAPPDARVVSLASDTLSEVDPWPIYRTVAGLVPQSPRIALEALLAGAAVARPDGTRFGPLPDEALVRLIGVLLIDRCQWFTPLAMQPVSALDALDHLEPLVRMRRLTRQPVHCIGITPWKLPAMRKFFLGAGPAYVRIYGGGLRARDRALAAAQNDGGQIICWSTRQPPDLKTLCRAADVPLALMEDGFIRSLGLGSTFVPPLSISIDHRGIYYDPNQESDLEHLIATATPSQRLLARTRALIDTVRTHNLSKYNESLAPEILSQLDPARRRVLVVGQVEDDQSILTAATGVRTNADLLAAARAARPQAQLIYKPHPDVVVGNRRGLVDTALTDSLADLVIPKGSAAALVSHIDEVHTMTSLLGFEALIRDIEVHSYGRPFYAGWGLTIDAAEIPRRTRRVSVEHLAACTLILYPHYRNPQQKLSTSAETVVNLISAGYREPLTVTARALRAFWRVRRARGIRRT